MRKRAGILNLQEASDVNQVAHDGGNGHIQPKDRLMQECQGLNLLNFAAQKHEWRQ